MSDIAAVSGATTTIKTLADGTFRLSIDIEPRHAQAAFALFGSPGTPVALARITNEAANAFERRAPEPEKPKGGELARMTGVLCQDVEFRVFMNAQGWHAGSDQEAAETIRQMCGVTTRADLDHDADAAAVFHRVIRGPWVKWKAARGVK